MTDLTISDEGAFDKENPKSLYNLLPKSQQDNLTRVKNSFLRDLSEYSTRKEIRHMTQYPLVRKLRQSFWMEYDDALKNKRQMLMTHIWQGLTVNASEFAAIMKQDHFAAFIFTKPVARDTMERSLLELAYEQIENILTADHCNSEGIMNPNAAKLKVDIWKHLDERVNGGVVKQIAMKSDINQTTRNTNVNVEATPADLHGIKRAEELNQRLADLRAQSKDFEAVSYVVHDDE